MLFTEVKCLAYNKFPTGVEGGSSDPCKPAASFQLSSTTDPSCSLKCKAGYERKGGSGASTLQCGKDGKLSGALACTGELPHIVRSNVQRLVIKCCLLSLLLHVNCVAAQVVVSLKQSGTKAKRCVWCQRALPDTSRVKTKSNVKASAIEDIGPATVWS